MWIRVFNAPVTSSHPVYALSEPLAIVVGAAAPQITSFTSVGGGVWELTLLGNPETAYEFRSSTIVDFNPGTPVEITGIEGDGTAGWIEQTLDLPAGDVGGKNIKIQFRFVTNAGSAQNSDVWSGFYIDDVTVTIP